MKVYLIVFIVTVLFSCGSSSNIESEVDQTYEKEILKCQNLKLKQGSNDSEKCIWCYSSLLKNYPDSTKAYHFLINEYVEIADFTSADSVYQMFINKFGKDSEILIQRNILFLNQDKKPNQEDIDILFERYKTKELKDEYKLDLAVLLYMANDTLKLKQINLSEEESNTLKSLVK